MSETADAGPLWSAIVRVAIASMHAEPRISSPMTSQQVAGHAVDVLEESDEWVRVRGEDAYEGWMHTGVLARAPQPYARGSRQFPRVSLGCVTTTANGGRRALPLLALLAPEEIVKSGEAVEANRMPERFPFDAGSIVATAQEYFSGTSYLWGGVTPWGADCSGLVQTTFALHSLALPRDAWQQAETGTDAGSNEAALRSLQPADLAFFSDRDDRRITHVAIALGDRRLVHLALGRGGYSIERLDDSSDRYVNRLIERFVHARRLF
ncbi:MAG: C40 family peptidase [Gemmatimonadaceae bacterium]